MKIIFIKVLVGILFGVAFGLISVPLSKKLILSRSEDPGDVIVLTADDETVLIRNLALLLPMLAIAIGDSLIRKIPNSLLLVMIITQAAYIAYVCITSHTTYALINAGIGFFLGFLAFTIPSFLKVPVGAGDVKYSAVIGMIMYLGCYLHFRFNSNFNVFPGA